MKKENKIKNFWEKNKATILIGAGSCVLGGVIAGVIDASWFGENRKLIRSLQAFKPDKKNGRTIVGSLTNVINGSNHVDVFGSNGSVTIAGIGEATKEYYLSKGFDLNTPVSGMAVFIK